LRIKSGIENQIKSNWTCESIPSPSIYCIYFISFSSYSDS